ncbi:MAG: iron ABC transporter permease [Lentisphaerae bacterium]|nr:iron ABC transporter permease [Lentisphaerota bacterium]
MREGPRLRVSLWVYGALFLAALAVLPWIGAARLAPQAVAAHLGAVRTAEGLIFFHQRVPRVLLALLTGGALALTGAALQVLFRNPLAEPWTLGVSGGAAIGAFAAQAVPALDLAFGPLTATQALALAGAAGVMAMIYGFARRWGAVSAQTLLLAGVTISIVSGSLIMLMTYFVAPYRFVSFHRWMMGGLDVIGYRDVWTFLVPGLPGLAILGWLAREYNHLALGEDTALGHGVDVARVQRWTFLGAGLTTAACVTVAGPIGFVGMIVPHVVRRLSGFDNRRVLPGAFLLGGAVLALCDGVGRTVIAPTEIPVGAITAVLGGPVFLYILVRR